MLVFNTKQRQVIGEIRQNILLSAGAGTGKTNVLAYRAANILNKKAAQPEEILCLTFTNRACRELDKRISSLLGKDSAEKITIRTIHGFAYQIITNTAKAQKQLFNEYVIFDDEDQKALIRRAVQKYPKGKSMDVRYIAHCIEQLKQERALQKIYTENLDEDYTAVYQRHLNFNKVFNQQSGDKLEKFFRFSGLNIITAYETLLHQMNGLDYKDLIAGAYRLLQNEDIRLLWRHKYKYIMIDEMQDTSVFEYTMLENLFCGRNVMLCGDEFQTIYEWRGSDPKRVLTSFMKKYAPLAIHFSENYRSTKILLETAYNTLINLFQKNIVEASYAKNMISKSDERGSKILFRQCRNFQDEAHWIFRSIIDLLPLTESLSDIVILARQNNYIKNLAVHLNYLAKKYNEANPQKPINFIEIDSMRFFKRQEIKDVLAVMKVLLNECDYFSLERVLINLVPNIGIRTIEQIRSPEYLSAGVRLSDFISPDIAQPGFDPFAKLIRAYRAEDIIVFDVEATGTDIFIDNIVQLSAVRIHKGEQTAVFNEYLKSEKNVGESEKIHRISDEFLAEHGKDPKFILEKFSAFIKNAVVAGHNIRGYDMDILNQNLLRRSLPPINFAKINFDTLDLSCRFYPNLPNHKLEYMSRYFNLETKSTHNSLDDVLATWNLLAKMLKEKIIPTAKERIELIAKQKNKFIKATEIFAALRMDLTDNLPLQDLIASIVGSFGLKNLYGADGGSRLEHLRRLYKIAKYELPHKTGAQAVGELLQYAALSASDLDAITAANPQIPIITVHQAKGLEFKYEFLAGMNDDIFPSYFSANKGFVSEEEKRLFYVAVTRAKKKLFLSCSGKESRLIKEIPAEFIERLT